MENKIIILGSGIAGLGAAYKLKHEGLHPVLLEKDDTYGGLCGNFVINGFRFDRFVHFSLTDNSEIKKLFEMSAGEVISHIPNPYNIYQRIWVKHPAQNNLYPLSEEEKRKIVADFLHRPDIDPENITNYEDWLRMQYGDYFAEHFPMAYTRKYWMCESADLETTWVGKRLYQPSIEEVIKGCQTKDTPVTYYAKEMRYPAEGGYKSFLKMFADGQDIRYHQEVVEIDPETQIVTTSSNKIYPYDILISSLPLPEILRMIKNVPEFVIQAGKHLRVTCGYQISIGLKTMNIPPYLWYYIYDEDILPARIYSPSLKSRDNVPEGCSSLQMEIYCANGEYSETELYERSVQKMIELGVVKEADILFVDIRFEKYANVIFTHDIYNARNIVREYLHSIGIKTIGRFGEWDYLWSDQSLISGMGI